MRHPGRQLPGDDAVGDEAGLARSRGGQARIPREDPAVQIAQLVARLYAELVNQDAPRPLIGRERLGLPPAPVQREHQLGVEALPQRVVKCELHQFPGQLRVPPQSQAGIHSPLERLHPQRVEPRYLGRHEHVRRCIRQRVPTPQVQALAQHIPCLRGGRLTIPPDRLGGLLAQRGEPQRVHLIRRRVEHVARITRQYPPARHRSEDVSQPLDVVADGHPGRGGRRTVPDDFGQLVIGKGLPSPERQRGQYHPLLGRRYRHGGALGPDQ